MNAEERKEKIDEFGGFALALPQALKEFPRSMWHTKPDPEHWSIQEIIFHLLDTEMNFYIRYRFCVAEPGKAVVPFNQDVWALKLRYKDRDVDQALAGLIWAIQANHDFLASLHDEDFAKTVTHPERGVLTLERILEYALGHIPHHIGQMRKRHNEWKALQK
jgi:uncharacterized damage-inducible protein DinB